MQVPRPIQGTALMEFAVTSPFLFTKIHFTMQTPNGQSPENPSLNEDSVIMSEPLIQSLRDLILSFDHREMAEALRLVHDITLYSSDITLEEKEKSALFQLKILWEGFEKIKEAS